MDDDRTHDALDNLADLFLTGTSSSPRPAAKDMRDQLDGPRPVRLPPKAAGKLDADSPSQTVTQERPDDDAPPLRLHRDEDTRPSPTHDRQPDAAPASLTVEAVLLGNLPGFGSPWLTQYADHVASTRGGVLLMHVDAENIDVELIGLQHEGVFNAPGMNTVAARSGRPLVDVLEHLVETGEPRHMIVHLSTDEQQLAVRAAAFEQWSMLSGSDDAAVVSVYRVLKHLMDAGAAGHHPHVGLMIMGSDGEASQAAAQKLNAACDSFLKMPIELMGHRKQMTPVNVRVVGSYHNDEATWSQLLELLDAVVSHADAEAPADLTPPTATAPPASSGPQPEPEHEPEVEIASEPAAADPSPPPVPVPSPEPTTVPNLASYLPGSVPLEARCPRHPQAQIVVDQDGVIHLLRRHEGEAASLKDALVDLIETRVWLREHIEIIRLTQRQCRFDVGVEPVLHLFSDQAKAAVKLANQLGEDLHLHLLQRVSVGPQQTWCCTALS